MYNKIRQKLVVMLPSLTSIGILMSVCGSSLTDKCKQNKGGEGCKWLVSVCVECILYLVSSSCVFKHKEIQIVKDRRESLCLNFAKKCLRTQKVKSIFPLNTNKRSLRNNNKYQVKFALTERHKRSTVPYLQNLLNEQEKVKAKFLRFKGF